MCPVTLALKRLRQEDFFFCKFETGLGYTVSSMSALETQRNSEGWAKHRGTALRSRGRWSLLLWGQHSEFQDSQSYIGRPCLEKAMRGGRWGERDRESTLFCFVLFCLIFLDIVALSRLVISKPRFTVNLPFAFFCVGAYFPSSCCLCSWFTSLFG